MFSINTIKSGVKEKEEYYTKDESLSQSKDKYYGKKQENKKTQEQKRSNPKIDKFTTAIFYGKGATKLGLEGAITKEEFKSLFYGYKPGTEERIRNNRPNKDDRERLGEDITLSPPKSFSITLHQGRDDKLFDAHTEAVKEVADVIEARYIQTREYFNGNRQRVSTGNAIAVLIPHHTSRDNDMQVHTHLIIFNGTERADGKYTALDTNAIAKQKWLGHLYQSILAQKVQNLGYSIRQTKDGFELEGISKEQIEVFSKRSRAIIQKIKDHGQEINHKNRDRAALTTRKAKNTTKTLEEYRERWRVEAKTHGIKVPIPKNKLVLKDTASHIIPKQQQTAKEALDSAIAHLSEPSVSFKRDNIYEYIYQSGLQSFSLEQLENEITSHLQLIPLNNDSTEFTTVNALKREVETAQQWLKGQGKATPLLKNPQVKATRLNRGQAEAIRRTLTSKDKHQIIHGLSGVGKTTALGILRNQLRETNITVKGFAPTIEAAKKLQQELNIETHTVARLTLATPEDKPNQLWIIDEAGLMSANAARTIIDKAKSVGARLLLVGDKGQNSSVEAGSPLRSLIKHGATTHKIEEIIRQQDSVQKQAVELIARGRGTQALQLLENRGYVTEIEDREERTATIAREYLKLSLKERSQTLIVTGTNKERLAITQQIRKGLQTEGKIGRSINAVQLTSRNLSKEQRSTSGNYRTGDYIKLFREYKSTNLQKERLYKVEKIEGSELIVSSSGGRIYRFDPSKYKEKQVFNSRKMEVAVGDKLRWTSGGNKKKGQINGKQVTVTAIDEFSITVEDTQKKSQQVSLLEPLPLDHNLVSTSYRAQGKSKKRVLVSATNDPTSSLEPFYVKISRQTTDLRVYTENLERLHTWVQQSNVQQNPIELIEQNYVRNTTSRDSEHTRDYTTAATTDRTTNSYQFRANSLPNSRSTQSVYQTVDRSNAEDRQQQYERINRGTNSSDSSSLHQNSQHQPHLYRNETKNTRLSTKPDNQQIDDRIGSIALEEFDKLAAAIVNSQIETELINNLKNIHTHIQNLERDIKTERIETISQAINEWELGRRLADSFKTLDLNSTNISSNNFQRKYSEVVSNTRSTLPTREFLFPDIEKLATAISQWQLNQDIAETLSQTAKTVNYLNKQRDLVTLKEHQYQFAEIQKLANIVSQQQVNEAIAHHLTTFQTKVQSIKTSLRERLDLLIDSFSNQTQIIHSQNTELHELLSSLQKKQSSEVFWQPKYPDSPPKHIEEKHWQEFQKSIIHPDLIDLNALSLKGREVYEYLLEDRLDKLGKVQYVTQKQKKVLLDYETVAEGGWWGQAGIDALSLVDLQPGEQPGTTLWGCFKPDYPRIDLSKSSEKGKIKHRKYENPSGSKRVPFLPEISDRLAEQIYQKHGINPTDQERKSGFWYVVKQYPKQIPITITEGFKKTLASLSQGEVTIGLTGVNHIYRSTDDNKNKLPKRQLNPEIAVFADSEREFRFAYDQDTKIKSIVNVRRDLVRGIELLEERGCQVKVLKWDSEDGKGLDDLIANVGPLAYKNAQQNAIATSLDKKIHYRTEYNKLAKKVRQELGAKIGEERLDLEIYVRAVLKGDKADGARVVNESDRVRSSLNNEHYVAAISAVAGTYYRLAQNNASDLDFYSKRLVIQQVARLQLPLEKTLEQNRVRERRSYHR